MNMGNQQPDKRAQLKIVFYFSTETYFVGTQSSKDCLNEMVL